MNTEIEVKFLGVDIEDMRNKLHAAGAVCEQPMRLMKRAIIRAANAEDNWSSGFVRVRDEGDRVTMTYKYFKELSIDGATEIETVVGDYEATVAILENAGLSASSRQESRRETWKLGDVEIVIDEWPWLKPYIEIEGESEQALREVAEKLGFDWDVSAAFGDVMVAYRAEYPHLRIDETLGDLPEILFDDPLPDMLKAPTE